MPKRNVLIARYAADLREKCGIEPDMDLLTEVTIAVGPAIYHSETAIVSAETQGELAKIKNNFLIRKLGLPDGPELMEAIDAAIETYGRSEPRKYRAVLYYMLVREFGKESLYA